LLSFYYFYIINRR